MDRQPEVSAAYARLVLQSGLVSPGQLLRGLSLTEQEVVNAEFLAAADLAVLFRNYASRVDDPTWTAQLGAQLNVSAHGPLGFAALSAPTLGEALDVMAELQACRNTAMTAEAWATDSHYCFQLSDVTGDAQFHRWMVEVVFKIVEILLASILGHPVGRNVRIRLAQREPAHAAALADCFDAVLQFDQSLNTIEVPLAWRQFPSPLYDEAAYRANLIKCREMIEARKQAGSFAALVRSRLRNHFDAQTLASEMPRPPPTLERMADDLHMAPRTLIRRLQRENENYRRMVEDLRREYAERLLRDARHTAAEVGEILGYSEAANFGRAFRRWYGQTPTAWRRNSA